ncbi:MAG: SAM-dependent methyltransferase [Acidobacteria bacterium]|nr:MAG: SAM-dependent methyltransferase [Acidobacteriota bacterium]
MADKVQTAYQQSLSVYDDVITGRKWWSQLYLKLFWDGVDDNKIAKQVLSYIPNDFSGKLLDVPVGTGVFTQQRYQQLSAADIQALDYSSEMLDIAKQRFVDLSNVTLVQGDVGDLPYPDDHFDIVLSMNGFHVFPDKEKAWSETTRVLKTGGLFMGCFYVANQSKRTDLIVKLLSLKGWFTPPFETMESLKNKLTSRYSEIELSVEGANAYFCAVKK